IIRLQTTFTTPCFCTPRYLHSFPTRRSSDLSAYSFGHDIEAAWLLIEAANVLNNPGLLKRTQDASLLITNTFISEAIDKDGAVIDRKSTRLNSSHVKISYAVFCLKKKKKNLD